MTDQTWRLLIEDDVTAGFGLAADETLARRVGRGESQPTLRLYRYRSHCALVGRFQNVEQELHLDFCRSHGIAVNRRPTGGGAIIMGAEQLGVALTMPGRERHAYGGARQLMERFSAGLLRALGDLGIAAAFRRRNDLEVDGRKIAGLGIYRDRSGGLLFHASLLVDLDVPLMLRVLRIPLQKIADKDIATVAARTCTVHSMLGAGVSFERVREQVAAGYSEAFGVVLERAAWSPAESRAIAHLERSKYAAPEWILQRTEVPDLSGATCVRTPAGLLEVRATLAGRQIKALHLSGDFFAAEGAIADLEGCLRWHSSDPAEIRKTLLPVYARWAQDLESLPLETLIGAIQRTTTRAHRSIDAESSPRADAHTTAHTTAHTAADTADDIADDTGSHPYGCFVTPGRRHA